jgi:tetratricopeptide (TPR) repeat protein
MSDLPNIIQAIEQGQYDKAITWCDLQLSQKPHHPDFLYQKGIALSKSQRFQEAAELFHQLVINHNHVAEYWEERALVWHKMGRQAQALDDFEQALRLEPDNPYRYACRAYIKDKMGDVAGAVADYTQVVAMDPEDDVARNNLELLEAKLGYLNMQRKQFFTPEHPTREEIAAYTETFQASRESTLPQEPQLQNNKPTSAAILKEAAQVLVSRDKWKEFWAFTRNGFKLPGKKG